MVNNAGVFQAFAYIEWCRPEDCMSIFQVNLIGLAQVTLSMLFLVKKARGRIVNVSSVLGRVALFGGFYSCSKYGVEAFSDVLRYLRYLGLAPLPIPPLQTLSSVLHAAPRFLAPHIFSVI